MGQKTHVGFYLTESTVEKFEKAVAERFGYVDGKKSQAAEKALLEWADEDRLERIERKVDRLGEGTPPTPSEPNEKTKRSNGGEESTEDRRQNSVAGTTGDRLDAIVADLPTGKTGTEVDKSKIRELVERHAGVSDSVFKKYLELLERYNHVLAHPAEDDVFFSGPEPIALKVEKGDQWGVYDAESVASDLWNQHGRPGPSAAAWWILQVHRLAPPVADAELKIDRHPETDTDSVREQLPDDKHGTPAWDDEGGDE